MVVCCCSCISRIHKGMLNLPHQTKRCFSHFAHFLWGSISLDAVAHFLVTAANDPFLVLLGNVAIYATIFLVSLFCYTRELSIEGCSSNWVATTTFFCDDVHAVVGESVTCYLPKPLHIEKSGKQNIYADPIALLDVTEEHEVVKVRVTQQVAGLTTLMAHVCNVYMESQITFDAGNMSTIRIDESREHSFEFGAMSHLHLLAQDRLGNTDLQFDGDVEVVMTAETLGISKNMNVEFVDGVGVVGLLVPDMSVFSKLSFVRIRMLINQKFEGAVWVHPSFSFVSELVLLLLFITFLVSHTLFIFHEVALVPSLDKDIEDGYYKLIWKGTTRAHYGTDSKQDQGRFLGFKYKPQELSGVVIK